MKKTLGELAALVKGEVVGDKNIVIRGLSGIEEAKDGDLTFIANPKYIQFLKTTKASAIIMPRDMEIQWPSAIRIDNPSLAFAQIAAYVEQKECLSVQGIHKTAIIADGVILGKNVSIGPYTVIERDCRIADNTTLGGGCYVGYQAAIGQNCFIYPNVTIRENTAMGNRVIIHSGSVIGSDGFGYEKVNGAHQKIPQIGTVVIEDDVEIGANVTIDRARFDKTTIGRGTKIDNLVHIAHNVTIGENCIIVAQTGISGSSKIGKECILAGQVGIVGHLEIGEGSVITAQSGISKSLPAFSKVSGSPARPHLKMQRAYASLLNLSDYLKIIQDLKKRVEALEKKVV